MGTNRRTLSNDIRRLPLNKLYRSLKSAPFTDTYHYQTSRHTTMPHTARHAINRITQFNLRTTITTTLLHLPVDHCKLTFDLTLRNLSGVLCWCLQMSLYVCTATWLIPLDYSLGVCGIVFGNVLFLFFAANLRMGSLHWGLAFTVTRSRCCKCIISRRTCYLSVSSLVWRFGFVRFLQD